MMKFLSTWVRWEKKSDSLVIHYLSPAADIGGESKRRDFDIICLHTSCYNGSLGSIPDIVELMTSWLRPPVLLTCQLTGVGTLVCKL